MAVITIIDLLAALGYMLGYLCVATLSFNMGEHHCWAYIVITFAAMIHLIVIIIRWRIRQGKKKTRKFRIKRRRAKVSQPTGS
jgi:uncharacterized membrane protein